jgi:hypothetical protein
MKATLFNSTFARSRATARRAVLEIIAAGLFTAAAQPAAAQMYPSNSPERIEITFDVAEDMNKYVEPRVPVGAEPLRGSFFVTQGNIYPAGTIPAVGGDQFDPNLPGAQGTWFCKGTFLVSGSQFDKNAMAVLTDQLFLLPNDERSIATTGTEGAGSAVRVVVGGTGPWAGYTGEQRQQFLGFNKSGGVNLRVTIRLRKTTDFR